MQNIDPLIFAAIIATLVFLLQAVLAILNIVDKCKRKPPIDQTLQHYLRREEFREFKQEYLKTYGEVFDELRKQAETTNKKLDALTTKLNDWQNGTERQMGRIEGEIKSCYRKQ